MVGHSAPRVTSHGNPGAGGGSSVDLRATPVDRSATARPLVVRLDCSKQAHRALVCAVERAPRATRAARTRNRPPGWSVLPSFPHQRNCVPLEKKGFRDELLARPRSATRATAVRAEQLEPARRPGGAIPACPATRAFPATPPPVAGSACAAKSASPATTVFAATSVSPTAATGTWLGIAPSFRAAAGRISTPRPVEGAPGLVAGP